MEDGYAEESRAGQAQAHGKRQRQNIGRRASRSGRLAALFRLSPGIVALSSYAELTAGLARSPCPHWHYARSPCVAYRFRSNQLAAARRWLIT